MRRYLDIPLTLILMTLLTLAMLWPINEPHQPLEWADKLVHFFAFAALAFPLARTGRFSLLSIFIGASAFGGAIELVQPSFTRDASLNDWIADILGSLLGIACGLFYRSLRT